MLLRERWHALEIARSAEIAVNPNRPGRICRIIGVLLAAAAIFRKWALLLPRAAAWKGSMDECEQRGSWRSSRSAPPAPVVPMTRI